MRILIDNSNLFAGGGIQVSTSFLKDVDTLSTGHEFFVVQSPNAAKQINQSDFSNNFTFFDIPENIHKSIIKRSTFVKNIEKQIDPNIIFTVFGPSYHRSKSIKVVGFAIPHLIYQDSPYFKQLRLLDKVKNFFVSKIKKFAFKRNSNVLVLESEVARQRFMSFFNKPTYVVSNTLNEVFLNTESWKPYKLPSNNTFKILCLTANYPHKNFGIIPQVIGSLLNLGFSDFTFYVSLKEEELIVNDKFKKHIHFLNRVDLVQLPNLYQQMDLLFMPSLLEVFSTTYLEAMHMKIPIVASDMPFARDICGKSAMYASPLKAIDYAKLIIDLYNNDSLRNDLIIEGKRNLNRFGNSLDRTKKYLEILEKYGNTK